MGKLSLDRFLDLVERSELIDRERLSHVVNAWKRNATLAELDDARPCASHLAEAGLLTPWQAHKLLEGRYRGFFLGKYKLLDHLGSGGMSSVYLAEHVLMQRQVAVKVLPHNRLADSAYLARFHLEAQAAAALDHRNIVRAYDLNNDGKIHYLVMEYVPGRDLDALVGHDGPLDCHAAADYIAQAAAGLEHAHHNGLVHRDIKPANLLLDTSGTIKILDMGLAKFTPQNRPALAIAETEQVLGTADYLAPEQAVNSQAVDRRADIYGLGCTLYFLLTGHPPFNAGTSLERMKAHQQQTAPSILLDRPDTPLPLLAICQRMMEKSPENRYSTATDVQRALCAWLEQEAAEGKIDEARLGRTQALAAVVRRRGEGGESKANLISGSAADLTAVPPELPRVASELQETDSNLHRATVRIGSPPRRPGESSFILPPGSEVLSVPGSKPRLAPPIPPLVAPPRASSAPAIGESTSDAAEAMPTPRRNDRDADSLANVDLAAPVSFRRRRSQTTGVPTLLIGLLAAVAFTLAILLLIALAS